MKLNLLSFLKNAGHPSAAAPAAQKTTLAKAFARAFGFDAEPSGPDGLHLRGTAAGGPCARLGSIDSQRKI